MSVTNYWNKLSGDSIASPWNQDNWAAGAPAQVPGTNPWMQMNMMQPQNMNDDRNKADERWGSQGFSDAGVGYWSGGRPGAGSWIEQLMQAAASTPPPAEGMVRGAPAQIPSRSAPVGENYMINNVQMSATEPLSNWYLKELAQTQPSSTTSRIKQKLF